jgi:hypothetical protein
MGAGLWHSGCHFPGQFPISPRFIKGRPYFAMDNPGGLLYIEEVLHNSHKGAT